MLNTSTAQDSDESAGESGGYNPPRLLRPRDEMTISQSLEGADEQPMSADEMKEHRKLMTETDVGRKYDLTESIWAEQMPGSK